MISLQSHAVAALFALGVFAPVLFWSMDREPMVIEITAVAVDDSASAPGGDLTVEWQIQKVKVCPQHAQNVLIDSHGTRHVFPPRPARTSKQIGALTGKFQYAIPVAAAPGRAVLQTIMFQRCNPVQHVWPVTISVPSVVFTIQNAPD